MFTMGNLQVFPYTPIPILTETHTLNGWVWVYPSTGTGPQWVCNLWVWVQSSTMFFIWALLHLFRSPSFPQPNLSTLLHKPPLPPWLPPLSMVLLDARARCTNHVIRTDFIQLLKLHSPMIHKTCLCSMPTSGCALSGQMAKLNK